MGSVQSLHHQLFLPLGQEGSLRVKILDEKKILISSRDSLPSLRSHCTSRAGSRQDPRTAPAHIPEGNRDHYICD